MLVWIIAFLSIAMSFFVKFMNRKDKQKEPNLGFWVKDNYPELIVSLLSMVILLIIAGKIQFNPDVILEKIPIVTYLPVDLIVAAIVGYLNNTLWYAGIKQVKNKFKV
jgi:amino acid transporter